MDCGAPTRTRTADLLITNQLLYQLSYRGKRFKLYLEISGNPAHFKPKPSRMIG